MIAVILFFMSRKEYDEENPPISFRVTKERKDKFNGLRERLGGISWGELYDQFGEEKGLLIDSINQCKQELEQARMEIKQSEQRDQEKENLATELSTIKDELEWVRRQNTELNESLEREKKQVSDLRNKITNLEQSQRNYETRVNDEVQRFNEKYKADCDRLNKLFNEEKERNKNIVVENEKLKQKIKNFKYKDILYCANCGKEYYIDKWVSNWMCNKCIRLKNPSAVPTSKSIALIVNLPTDLPTDYELD